MLPTQLRHPPHVQRVVLDASFGILRSVRRHMCPALLQDLFECGRTLHESAAQAGGIVRGTPAAGDCDYLVKWDF
jgi:hypothetical protein